MLQSKADDAAQPPLTSRWFYAFEDGWKTFTDTDDAKLEERWKQLSERGILKQKQEERKKKEQEAQKAKKDLDDHLASKEQKEKEDKADLSWPPSGVDTIRNALSSTMGYGKNDAVEKAKEQSKPKQQEDKQQKEDIEKRIVTFHLDPDEPSIERETKVEVMEDNLFDVDVSTMELFPVFWKGVLLRVVRAHWFYVSNDGGFAPIPYDENLSSDLDRAYDKIKPWKEDGMRAVSDEKTSTSKDMENSTQDELVCELPSMQNTGRVEFDKDGVSGRIFTQDITGKIKSFIGGSAIIRGWQETAKRSEKIQDSSIFDSSILPWAGGQSPNERERMDQAEERGSKQAQRREGAAQVSKKPSQATDKDSLENVGGEQEQEANQGFIGKLWPSTDSMLNPRVRLLRALGWDAQDAKEEGQRSAKQENTEEALRGDHKQQSQSGQTKADGSKDKVEGVGEDQQDGKEDVEDPPNDRTDQPPELVLAIHGIGQKLTDDFDAIDFVYDVERLRNLAKTCAQDDALKRISHGKRAQFLPICWRKELSFDDQEACEGNDNVYGLKDVSNDATIPIVRNVISKVILDVPYYLSRHKQTMLDAVVHELNRVYRLFVRRNPDFERKGGRVSLICHSLGSALAAEILSNQPTQVKPLDQQTHSELHDNQQLVFNVRNLFFVGSPNGFFFHLDGAQMIARRGTARTLDVESDAASDQVGRLGCMAAEAVYNCFNATDPVAFRLSATVDRAYAQMLRPISIPDAVPALMEALAEPRLSLSKYFEVTKPFAAKADSAAHSGASTNTAELMDDLQGKGGGEHTTTSNIGRPVLVEQGSQKKIEQIPSKLHTRTSNEQQSADEHDRGQKRSFDLARLQRAERRFRALNPHGCLDFVYASGGMNEYLDMLSAHVSYWTSKSFTTFILTQLLSDFAHDDKVPTIVPSLSRRHSDENDENDKGNEQVETRTAA